MPLNKDLYSNMKVSVLINNYNYAAFITECLDSVQAQSQPIHEIIVVDDGSTDDSVERIKAHPLNVTCIEKENGGQYSAMQVAIQAATGDIFCFLDSDDTWHPDYLKIVCEAFRSERQPDFVYTGLTKIGEESGPHHLNSEIQYPQFFPPSQQLLLARRVYLGGPTSANSIKATYAKTLFEDSSTERLEDYRLCADQILVYGSSLIGCTKLQLTNKLVNYRVHSNNGFHNKDIDESEQRKNEARFLRLQNQISSELNIKLDPSRSYQEFFLLLKSSTTQQHATRFYLKSYKEMNIGPIRKRYWKTRLKLIYKLAQHATHTQEPDRIQTTLTQKIKNLLSKNRKIICSTNCRMTGDYKELKQACKKHQITLRESRITENTGDRLDLRQPIPHAVLSKIAMYPSCVQANHHWADLDDQTRIQLLELWIPKLERIAAQHHAKLESEKPDAILIFQGYTPDDAILRHLAVQRGIPIIAIENTMRSDRLIWESISGITVNRNQAHLQFWRHQSIVSLNDAKESVAAYLSKIKEVKNANEHSSPTHKYIWKTNSKKILFLGQVYTDSSQLFGPGDFNNPIEVIGALLKWTEENQHSLVIKLHPKEHTGRNPITSEPYADITYRRIIENYSDTLQRLGEQVYIDHQNEYDTYDLIEQCALVATVNSQAGLEAAIMDKAVIHGRQCFYGGLGFTHEYQDKLDIELRLTQALQEGPKNINDAKKFFHILFEHYCIKKDPDAVAKLLRSRTK